MKHKHQAHPTITCPVCKMEQTGIVRTSWGVVRLIVCEQKKNEDEFLLSADTPYIRCAYLPCQHLIFGDELNQVLTPVIKYPSEIREQREGAAV